MTTTESDATFHPGLWLENAIKGQRKAQQTLDLDLMIQGKVDEVSLLFKSVAMMERFIGWCEAQGWRNFSTVKRDTATQLYGNSLYGIGNRAGPAFDVRFEFLKPKHGDFAFPDDWRIECMYIFPNSFAPLHDTLTEGAVAHASWKVTDFNGYLKACSDLEALMPKMAEYENSYGRFGYFGQLPPYFKPRINLRDDAQTSMPGL